jgi:hypothetical protein
LSPSKCLLFSLMTLVARQLRRSHCTRKRIARTSSSKFRCQYFSSVAPALSMPWPTRVLILAGLFQTVSWWTTASSVRITLPGLILTMAMSLMDLPYTHNHASRSVRVMDRSNCVRRPSISVTCRPGRSCSRQQSAFLRNVRRRSVLVAVAHHGPRRYKPAVPAVSQTGKAGIVQLCPHPVQRNPPTARAAEAASSIGLRVWLSLILWPLFGRIWQVIDLSVQVAGHPPVTLY